MASTAYDPMNRAGLEFWLHTQAGDNSERRRRLLRNLPKAVAAELTPRQREVLALYMERDMNVTQIAAVLGVAFLLCGEPFLYIFTNDADVVAAGMERMRIMCFSYCVSAFMDCTIAACRGIGRSFVPTVIVIMGSCVFRVVWIYTVFAFFHTITSLYLLYIVALAVDMAC